jgi:hypothetical protein
VKGVDVIDKSQMVSEWSPDITSPSFTQYFKDGSRIVRIKLGSVLEVVDPVGNPSGALVQAHYIRMFT